MSSIHHIRSDYEGEGLHKKDLLPDPVHQFEKWFHEVLDIPEEDHPNAMTLSTVHEGRPSSRMVLLKGTENGNFIFFTNYKSRKSSEIAHNPNVSLVFWWRSLARQVRIEGIAEFIPEKESELYFLSRPVGSQLSAIVSPQSNIIPNREYLEKKLEKIQQKLLDGFHPKRPKNWGGYRVIPDYFEFWQGRPNRLHDRFQYKLTASGFWEINRLAP